MKVLRLNVLLLFLLGVTVASAREVVDKIVATVNNEVITLSDLNKFRSDLQKAGKAVVAVNEMLSSQKNLLEALIDEKLVEQVVKKSNITPSVSEIEDEIKGIEQAQNINREALITLLNQQGVDFESYKKNIKSQMERQRLLEREIRTSIDISEKDLKNYYYNQIVKKGKKEYRLRQILFGVKSPSERTAKKNKAQEVMDKLRKGESFTDLAKKYSEDTTSASQGGDIGFVAVGEMHGSLDQAVQKLKEGGTSGVVTSPAGFHILQLVAVRQGAPGTFEELRNQIHQHLFQREFEKARRAWLKKKKEESLIKRFL